MSSVLDRVKLFLPQIAEANKELKDKVDKFGPEIVQIDSSLNLNDNDDDNDDDGDNDSKNDTIDKETSTTTPLTTNNNNEKDDYDDDSDEEEVNQPQDKKIKLEFMVGAFEDNILNALGGSEIDNDDNIDSNEDNNHDNNN